MLAHTSTRKITLQVMLFVLGAEMLLGFGWWVLSEDLLTELVPKQQMLTHFAVLMAMSLVVALVATYIFSRILTPPLESLQDALHRLSKGEQSIVVDFKAGAMRGLASEFNQVSKHVDKLNLEGDQRQKQLADAAALRERDRLDIAKKSQELKTVHESLIRQASEVGTAKMVIGLMHNIGNALTPAIIDTTTSLRHLQNSALRHHLAPALKPLKDIIEQTDLLENDVKYRLTQIVKMLPDSIQEEYTKVIISLERVSERHAHIEEIINLQMRYTQDHRECQIFALDSLIRDALKLLQELINKYDIKVITNFAKLPELCWDEPRLLQILINVIKNGCEAMMDSDYRRTLTLTTTLDPQDDQYLVLSVEDNGIGFDEVEKEQMFTFGYSTKNRRPGFGLHTYANDLIAQKGSIEGLSDGRGKGANFIIRLPFESEHASKAVPH